MKETIKALGQLGILWAIYRGSAWLVATARLPVPGNVLGVVALFLLLCSGVLKLRHVELAADFLLRHLVFFFMAIAVGLMDCWRPFVDYGPTLLAAIILSAILPLYVVGRLAQRLNRERP
mgnify:CR=1 FL=1